MVTKSVDTKKRDWFNSIKRKPLHNSHAMGESNMELHTIKGLKKEFFSVQTCKFCGCRQFVGIYGYHCDDELFKKCIDSE